MNSDTDGYQTHLFTVRLWREDQGAGRFEWRGRIRSVASGETVYFQGWPTLIERLQTMLPGAETDRGEHNADEAIG